MKILVTGSSGLIGRWVVQTLLKQDGQVAGIDKAAASLRHNNYAHFQGDILNPNWMQKVIAQVTPEAVIHLAARTDLNGEHLDDYRTNMEGVKNLVDAVRQNSSVRRAIYTSSQLVCRIGHVPRSDTEYCPGTLYGKSKVITEQIVRESDGGGKEWIICRPTTVWGPYMNEHYRRFLKHIEAGHYFHVGRGQLFKSYAYAGNIAWQYYRLLAADAELVNRQTYYLADYEPLSLRDYTNQIQQLLGARKIPTCPKALANMLAWGGDLLAMAGWKTFPFTSFRLRNILTEYVLDLSKTKAVCGELPYHFEEGVRATVAWYRDQTAQRETLQDLS